MMLSCDFVKSPNMSEKPAASIFKVKRKPYMKAKIEIEEMDIKFLLIWPI